jgi:pyruvate-formate lyase-activating enzyme
MAQPGRLESMPATPLFEVAFVHLHAQAGGDFFSDLTFAWTAGELREANVLAELVHVHYPRGGEPEPLTRALLAAVQRCAVVVLGQVWDPALVGRLQAQGARVVATDPHAVWGQARPDYLLAHVDTHRAPLRELILALRDGRDPHGLVNLPGGPEVPYPAEREAILPFCPVPDARVIGTPIGDDGRPPPRRKWLDTNSGCPFAEPARTNPAWAGVPMPDAGVADRGCAFCFMGGDYRALPLAETVAVHLRHLAWYQQHGELDEVVLRDQSALRYLPELVRGAQAAGLRPVGLLVPGRGDAILRWGRELRRAAELASGTGFWFTIHLIGFESFSQAQLDRFNKGVAVADYAEALRQMRSLADEFPDAFRLGLYGASSFIVFEPWVTPAELQETVDFCRAHGVAELAQGLTLTRLRLYPNLPLYWKARHDGLLLDGAAPSDRGAAFTGYSAEVLWRYREPRVQSIEDLQRRLHPLVPAGETVGLLATVLAWARDRLPRPEDVAPSDELDAIVAQVAAGLPERRPLAQWVLDAAPAQARTVLAGHGCNNRCLTCVAEHGWFSDRPERVRAQVVAAAAAHGEVTLAGREPTLLPQLLEHVRAARAAGATSVRLVTNGRLLASPGVAARLARAGATQVVVKRHRLADADEDAYVQVPGAGAQMWAGVAAARAAGLGWTLLLVAVRGADGEHAALTELARERGARGIEIQRLVAELDLGKKFAVDPEPG